jgi:hypothetical protein
MRLRYFSLCCANTGRHAEPWCIGYINGLVPRISTQKISVECRKMIRVTHQFQTGRILRVVTTVALTLSLVQGISNACFAQKNAGDGAKGSTPHELKNILVFTTDTKGGVSDQVADDIVAVIKSRLMATKMYQPIGFPSSIPTVKLALAEQTLTQSDVRKPFDSDVKLKKLAGVTGYNYVIVSSIDDYQYDTTKNQVSIVLSIRLVDYSGAKPVPRSAGSSATSAVNTTNTPELKIASDLVRGLADKLMTAILTPTPTTQPK